jgi:hypothetical protein
LLREVLNVMQATVNGARRPHVIEDENQPAERDSHAGDESPAGLAHRERDAASEHHYSDPDANH